MSNNDKETLENGDTKLTVEELVKDWLPQVWRDDRIRTFRAMTQTDVEKKLRDCVDELQEAGFVLVVQVKIHDKQYIYELPTKDLFVAKKMIETPDEAIDNDEENRDDDNG